jgi:hypothetical protein
MSRKPYPSDPDRQKREFLAPCLTLMAEKAPQREYGLREVARGAFEDLRQARRPAQKNRALQTQGW